MKHGFVTYKSCCVEENAENIQWHALVSGGVEENNGLFERENDLDTHRKLPDHTVGIIGMYCDIHELTRRYNYEIIHLRQYLYHMQE